MFLKDNKGWLGLAASSSEISNHFLKELNNIRDLFCKTK